VVGRWLASWTFGLPSWLAEWLACLSWCVPIQSAHPNPPHSHTPTQVACTKPRLQAVCAEAARVRTSAEFHADPLDGEVELLPGRVRESAEILESISVPPSPPSPHVRGGCRSGGAGWGWSVLSRALQHCIDSRLYSPPTFPIPNPNLIHRAPTQLSTPAVARSSCEICWSRPTLSSMPAPHPTAGGATRPPQCTENAPRRRAAARPPFLHRGVRQGGNSSGQHPHQHNQHLFLGCPVNQYFPASLIGQHTRRHCTATVAVFYLQRRLAVRRQVSTRSSEAATSSKRQQHFIPVFSNPTKMILTSILHLPRSPSSCIAHPSH